MRAFATILVWCPLVPGATSKFLIAPPLPLSLDGENFRRVGDAGHLAKHVTTPFEAHPVTYLFGHSLVPSVMFCDWGQLGKQLVLACLGFGILCKILVYSINLIL